MAYETPIVYNLDGGSGGNGGGCGNSMWGGDGSWIFAFLIIALIFGDRWGNNGNNGGNNGGGNAVPTYIPYPTASIGGFNASGALTRADLCQDMNFQEVKNGVAGVSDAVALGFSNLNSTICNQQYDTAQMVNGLNTTLLQGFNAANVVALQNQNSTQAQIAQSFCDEKAALADLKYTIASEDCATRNIIQNGFRDSIDATNAGTRAILDYLCQEKIADLQSENQGLRLAASQSAQNQYLISQLRPCPVPAYITCNPYTSSYGIGLTGNGCGCNTGCGC